jgi:hypothetical protein
MQLNTTAMKAAMTFAALASLLIVSCEKSTNDGTVKVGKRFEIYLTATP